MKTPMTFTITAQHLKLIREMWVGWQEYPEEHRVAPEIDPKRPYGNSSVFRDVAKIIGDPPPDEDGDWAPGQEDRLVQIHAETATALQIVLLTGSFEPGEFRRTDPWSLCGEPQRIRARTIVHNVHRSPDHAALVDEPTSEDAARPATLCGAGPQPGPARGCDAP